MTDPMDTPWPFHAAADGVEVTLQLHEQDVLVNLLSDLRHLLMADDHESLRRLTPPAHPGDDEAEASYRAMVDDDLLRGRLELLERMEAGVAGTTLDEEGVAAWMQGLNMIRLVLGERLHDEGADLTADALPDGPASVLYLWTGELLELLVRAASVTPPDSAP